MVIMQNFLKCTENVKSQNQIRYPIKVEREVDREEQFSRHNFILLHNVV